MRFNESLARYVSQERSKCCATCKHFDESATKQKKWGPTRYSVEFACDHPDNEGLENNPVGICIKYTIT